MRVHKKPKKTIIKTHLQQANCGRTSNGNRGSLTQPHVPNAPGTSHQVEEAEEATHICCYCNKEFSTGNALGGHMRVHKKPNKTRRGSCRTRPNGNCGSLHPTTCSACGKHFPSDKSLYGHMRCHPDRHWRGMQPPLPLQTLRHNSSSSTISDASLVDNHIDTATGSANLDLCTSLSGWSAKARRIPQTVAAVDSSPDPIMEEAALSLLELHYGNRKKRSHEEESLAPINPKKPMLVHECKKTFPTDQALGGHKTCQ